MHHSWQPPDFLVFETWLHADAPRVSFSSCGRVTLLRLHWAGARRSTLLFDAMALSMRQGLVVREAARTLRARDKQSWRSKKHCVDHARAMQDLSRVGFVGVDEDDLGKGYPCVTVVRGLEDERLLLPRQARISKRSLPSRWRCKSTAAIARLSPTLAWT